MHQNDKNIALKNTLDPDPVLIKNIHS